MGKKSSWVLEVQFSPTIKQQHTGMALYEDIILSWILVPSGASEVWSPKKIREHWQKTFIMLSEFLPLKRWVEWIRWKILFSDNVEWSSKNLWKMISADVKANIKQQEINDLVAVSYNFFWVCIFYFYFGWYPKTLIQVLFHLGHRFWARQKQFVSNTNSILS